jgi:hypothetical protein
MRVTLATRGGLAAALRRQVRAVSSDALDAEEERELRRLVSAAAASPSVRGANDRAGRDVMSYTIAVDDGGAVRQLSATDTTMSPAFAALLEWLERHTS